MQPCMFFEDLFQATDGVTYRQAGEKVQFEAEMKRMIEVRNKPLTRVFSPPSQVHT